MNKELRRILAGASIATLVAGAGIAGLGCAKRAHGS
ncbi:MAG: SbtA family thio(seleno)oxazole RiPP natural product precursor [Thermodesulfobacteriota bacterium]